VKKTAQNATSAANKSGTKSTTAAKSTTSTSTTAKSSSVSSAKTTSSASKTAKKVEEVKPIASKADPLADVSFLDNAGETPAKVTASNGASKSATPASAAQRADAVQRARNRRLQAGYNQPR
jgi:hypothetical protein